MKSALADTGTSPSELELEVTESTLIADSAPAVAALRSLRRLGVGLAIDDFGTGYSSLAYLRRFPVDRLKLDMSFIAGIGNVGEPTGDGEALVAAAIALAHARSRGGCRRSGDRGATTCASLLWLRARTGLPLDGAVASGRVQALVGYS